MALRGRVLRRVAGDAQGVDQEKELTRRRDAAERSAPAAGDGGDHEPYVFQGPKGEVGCSTFMRSRDTGS